jgi:purine-cytosine permease-like protein
MTGATPPQCVFQNVLLFFLCFLLLLLLVVAVVAVVVADTGIRESSWLGRQNLMENTTPKHYPSSLKLVN